MQRFSLQEFKQEYGTHDQCLEAIKRLRFPDIMECPKCKFQQKFYKVTNRTSYACNNCGYHIYPLAGTIFEKTSTPLDQWFFAMYLMTQTRSGTSAKQLERMLGVTYKTAWRMFKQIRMLMVQSPSLLEGIVEVDETFIGGKGINRAYEWRADKKKEIVMGMVERRGKAYLKHIPNTNMYTLINQVKENINPKAFVMSDEWHAYKTLYQHGYSHHYSVVHSDRQFVKWKGLVHNNTIESLWSQLKRGIYGVYRNVSVKYLQAYVDEYAWRYNNRLYSERMFDRLLRQITEITSLKVVKPA